MKFKSYSKFNKHIVNRTAMDKFSKWVHSRLLHMYIILKMHELDLLLGILFPFILTLFLLYPLFSKPGYIFYGDEIWNFYANPVSNLMPPIYAWSTNGGPANPNSFFVEILSSFFLIFGNYFANHALIFILAFLPGATAYFSILYSLKLFNSDNLNVKRLAALIGSIFYLVNWQNTGLISPMLSEITSYIIMPVLIYLMIKIYKEHKFYDILLFGAVSVFGASFPAWLLFMPLFAILYIPFTINGNHKIKKLFYSIILFISIFATAFIFNAYVLIPSLGGFLLHAGGQYSAYSNTQSFLAGLNFLSFYHLTDVVMYGQPSFQFFGFNPQNWTAINILIPLTAVVAIIISIFTEKKNVKYSIYFFIATAIALFLAKGVNPPFGYIYDYVVIYSPPGIAGITRDVTPWMQMAAVSYAFLFGIASESLFKYIHENGIKNIFVFNNIFRIEKMTIFLKVNKKIIINSNIKHWPFVRVLLVVIVVCILFGALFASYKTTQVTLNYYIYQRFSPTYPPPYYSSLLNEINALHPAGNVMWLPSGGTDFSWKDNYILTSWGPNLYPNSTSSTSIYPYIAQNDTTTLGKVLALTDSQYLVYQSSGIVSVYPNTYSPSYVLNFLNSQTDLKLVYHTGEVWLYKNLENVSSVYAGIPDYLNSVPSPFNMSGRVIAYSNVYVNSSNIFQQLSNLGMLEYQKVLHPYITNNSIYINLKNNEQAYITYGSEKTYYMYNSTIASLNNIHLNGSTYNLNINYTLPGYVYNYTKSNVFSAGFGPLLEVYPYNQNPQWGEYLPPTNRMYENVGYKVLKSKNTSGELGYTMPELSNVSVYLAFHVGCYGQISGLYYVFSLINGRVSVNPIKSENYPLQYQFINKNITATLSPFVYASSTPNIITNTNSKQCPNTWFYFNESYIYPEIAYVGNNLASNAAINLLKHANIIPAINSNATYLNENSSYIYSHMHDGGYYNGDRYLIMRSRIALNASTIIAGNYTMYLNVYNGTLVLNNITYKDGFYRMLVYINNSIMMVAESNSKTMFSIDLIQKNVFTNTTVSKFTMVSPVEYNGVYSSNTTGMVVLAQPYSPLWVLTFNGKTYSPISVDNGILNGFLLPSGYGHFVIYYKMQEYNNIGFAITGISFAISFIVGIVYIAKRKRNKHEKNSFSYKR